MSRYTKIAIITILILITILNIKDILCAFFTMIKVCFNLWQIEE